MSQIFRPSRLVIVALMHFRHPSGLDRMTALIVLAWPLPLLILTLCNYLIRGAVHAPW
jgi:hypothetical protein